MQKRDRLELVASAATQLNLDVICLAECNSEGSVLADQLNALVQSPFQSVATNVPGIGILVREGGPPTREVYSDLSRRLSICELQLFGTEFLFCVVHAASKLWNNSPSDQSSRMQSIGDMIRREEERQGHERTILCGDLNVNPFEDGVVMSHGLHAIADRRIAAIGSRVVESDRCPFFYNPMWGLLGDTTPGPPGTMYYRGERVSYEWHLVDQVMIRGEALRWFSGHVEILTRIGDVNLATELGRPNRGIGSDHFPIVFLMDDE